MREVERVAADGVEDQVLQLVDSGEQILAERSHGYGAALLDESENKGECCSLDRSANGRRVP